MKIAFVDQPIGHITPGKVCGSINMIVYEMARRLARTAEVIVYTRRLYWQSAEEILEGVRYKRIDTRWEDRIDRRMSRLSQLREPGTPWFLSRFYYRAYIEKIARDARREKCDVIHAYSFPQFATVLRAKNPTAKIVLNMQCEWLHQLDRKTIDHHLNSVDRVVSCSEFLTQQVKNRFPHVANRCITVPNGADREKFALDPGQRNSSSKRILYTGRISPEKGVHVLIDAFSLVAAKDREAELHLIGVDWIPPRSFFCDLSDDPIVRDLAPLWDGYLERLKARVPAELRERVRFLGGMSQSEMTAHYARAWVAVHPSVCQEAFGMPVTEAMMSSLPVVVTASGGMPEQVIHGKTGFIVPRNSPRALADALVTVLQDRDLRDRMGEAGRTRALELFSWEQVADKMVREYDKILATPAPTRELGATPAIPSPSPFVDLPQKTA